MPTPLEAQQELARRELARRQLGRFVKYMMPTYQENWHHAIIFDKLQQVAEGKIKKLMIFVPPRHGKSEIASIHFPAWFFGKYPDKSIIASSYNADLAVSFGRKARNIVNSAEYANVFDDPAVKLADDTKAAGQWNTNFGGEYTAIGIGGGATGRGAHVFLIDDPVKDMQEAQSPVIQERNIDWYRSVAVTRLTADGALVVIETRWHHADLAGMILAEEDGWEIIDLPAIAIREEANRHIGEALWPSRFPLDVLEQRKKSLGSTIFSALYQQRPVTEESAVFKKNMFKYRTLEEVLALRTRCFTTIDPAPGKNEKSDYIGVTVNFVDSENMWNLISYRVKFDAAELIKLLFKINEDYHPEAFGIEKGMYKDVLKPFLDAEMLKRNKWLIIKELDHGQRSKSLRIVGLQPRYEAGTIYHIIGMCQDLEDELLVFPKATHDDVSDSAAYQNLIAEAPENIHDEWQTEVNRNDRMQDTAADAGLA